MATSFDGALLLITSRCAQTIASQRIHLARRAQRSGWKVCLAGHCADDGNADRLRAESFDFDCVPLDQRSLRFFPLVRLILAYVTLFSRVRPTVVHAFTIKPTVAAILAAALTRVPVRIATVAGLGHVFLSSGPAVRSIAILLLRFSLSFAHRVFFYNESDRDVYLAHRILPAWKVRLVAGSGVDIDQFKAVPLPGNPRLAVAFVGRLLREKGVPELFAAVENVRQRGIDIQLHLVGDVDANNPSALSQADVDQAVARGDVVWHGHVNDTRPIIAQADVIILPSHREGIPMALLEGAAMGRALIATDVPGCNDVVHHGKNGLITPLGDPVALADAIATLALDRSLTANMGREARQTVVLRFNADVVSGIVLEEYQRVLKNPGKPAL